MADYIEVKSILSRLKNGPDPYFGIAYNMNLYRGCQHQYIYCDSRSKVYGIDDFSKIKIKSNAIQLLLKTLSGRIKKGTIGTGSMNDPYMPIEKELVLVRSALEVIAAKRFPVHVITKSTLVERDIDLLTEVGKVYSAVSFTITTSDDNLAKKIEPGAPVSTKRFKTLELLTKNNIYCGIIITPVLPFITDSEENILRILQMAKDSGASYVLGWMGMTQRDGQREYYYDKLNQLFPGLSKKYNELYGRNYNCRVPESERLYDAFKMKCIQLDLSKQMRIYSEQKPEQLSLFDRLHDELKQYSILNSKKKKLIF